MQVRRPSLTLLLLGLLIGCGESSVDPRDAGPAADGSTEGDASPDGASWDADMGDGGIPSATVCRGEAVCAQLFVQEALPGFEEGRARDAELVTFGVPLSEDDNVTHERQLAVRGADAQIRILRRHDGGTASWVAIDAIVSLEARAIAELQLVPATTEETRPALASMDGEVILIDTQAAQFRVPRAGGSLLDSVVLGGAEQLEAPLALYAETPGPVSMVPSLTGAEVTENGPIKTVVRLEGELSESAEALAWFTVRLTFVRGREEVRAEVTFQNDRQARLEPFVFHALGLRFQPRVGDDPDVTFGEIGGDGWTGAVADGAHLYQGIVPDYPLNDPIAYVSCWPVETFIAGTCEDFVFTPGASQTGVDLRIGASSAVSGGSNTRAARGDMLLEGGGASVAVAQRWMAAMPPAALEVSSDSTVDIAFYSRRNPRAELALEWGAHDTRQVLIDFAAGEAGDSGAAAYRINYPLVGRASFEHYMRTRALYGTEEWVTLEEQRQYFESRGDDVPFQAQVEGANVRVLRVDHWRRHYYHNQKGLLDFIRSGDSSYMLRVWQDGQFEMDYGFAHSGDFDLGEHPPIAVAHTGQVPYDSEHQLTAYLPLLYAMTADERIGEAIPEYGESVLGRYSGYYPEPRTVSSFRGILRAFENFAWLWQHTGDERYLEEVRDAIDEYVDGRGRFDEGVRGRDLDRGFIYGDSSLYTRDGRSVHSFFGIQILGQTMYDVRRILRETGVEYRDQELEDALVGHAQFLFREVYDPIDLWGAEYPIDRHEPEVSGPVYLGARWATLLYDVLGDVGPLERSYSILMGRFAPGSGGGDTSHPQIQSQMWYATHRPEPADGWTSVEIEVSESDAGYVLEWTVPEGARRYRIKASDRPIVEWLGFDPEARTFDYDPSSFTAWFAAPDLASAPAPETVGSRQSWTVEGLEAGQHFSVVYSTR